jgi:hypothetical protein
MNFGPIYIQAVLTSHYGINLSPVPLAIMLYRDEHTRAHSQVGCAYFPRYCHTTCSTVPLSGTLYREQEG